VNKWRVLDLFSGIGGFSLGLERAGMKTVAFCEIDPFCRRVLAKHWPDVPCHDDITTREFVRGEADVICGGFPCQDISYAGDGAGLSGSRSGLYRELVRAIRLVRPRVAIVENVAALLNRGLGTVLGDVAEIGYDAEWHCVPASAVGAPHRRDRIWIVAHPDGAERRPLSGACDRLEGPLRVPQREEGSGRSEPSCSYVADADKPRLEGWLRTSLRERASERAARESGASLGDAARELLDGSRYRASEAGWREPSDASWWRTEPNVGRVAHGVSGRVDRLKGLGNAVVPQIPELIGRAIVEAEGEGR
jgi:DNA (cytosine-5)-methyltransferase 1